MGLGPTPRYQRYMATGLSARLGYYPKLTTCKSFRIAIVDSIKKTYPFLKIVLEYKMPKTILRIDIYLPDISLGIEIQGIQHYQMNSFFHKDSSSFLEANLRDKEKKAIAANNNIDILYIKYNQKKYLDIVFSKINGRILRNGRR